MLIAIKVIVFTLSILSLLAIYILPIALVIGGVIYYNKYCSDPNGLFCISINSVCNTIHNIQIQAA
jgi:hypothetical protein